MASYQKQTITDRISHTFWILLFTTALTLSFTFSPATHLKAQAAFGEGGYDSNETSRYLGLIDWVDWSACDGPDNCRKLEKRKKEYLILLYMGKLTGAIKLLEFCIQKIFGTVAHTKLRARHS
ncbi:hypothetical protein RQN30_06405 [Arcanobacterium hippocoleae]